MPLMITGIQLVDGIMCAIAIILELAAIERIWRFMKWYTREHCRHTVESMKELVNLAIRSVTRSQILQVDIIAIFHKTKKKQTTLFS